MCRVDCEQSLHESVERPAFLGQSCFVTQTNKMTEGGTTSEKRAAQLIHEGRVTFLQTLVV